MNNQNVAVLTSDIVNSTNMSAEELNRLIKTFRGQLKQLQDQGFVHHFEFYRGDSAQIIIPVPKDALEIALRLKTAINRLDFRADEKSPKRGQPVSYDSRWAIGLGAVSTLQKKMTNEKPFVRSGRELDRITDEGLRMGIASGVIHIDKELATELYLYEWIMEQWSLQTARVVYYKFEGLTERDIARRLGISQSAVNQHSQAAHWKGLQRIVGRYKELVETYTG